MDIPTEVIKLIKWIWVANYNYHNDPEISVVEDHEYDVAVNLLCKIADKHPEWVTDDWPIFNNLTPPEDDLFWLESPLWRGDGGLFND